jgi:hypothetical protein
MLNGSAKWIKRIYLSSILVDLKLCFGAIAMSTPPPSDRRFDGDEFIAVVVALAAIGGILFWGMRRVSPEFATLWAPLVDASRASEPEPPPADRRSFVPFGDPAPTPDTTLAPDPATAPVPPGITAPQQTPPPTAVIPPPPAQRAAIAPDPRSDPETAPAATPTPIPPTAVAPVPGTVAPGTVAPGITPEVTFPDVPTTYWAYPFIAGLAAQGLTQGFQDGSFQPDAPTSRAQFAAALQNTFPVSDTQSAIAFADIPGDYWAEDAIDAAVRSDFMRGYPDDTFRPNQSISRLEMLLSLVSGLQLAPPENPEQVLAVYPDAEQIPDYALPAIAAATQAQLVVLPPGETNFNPAREVTRAEMSATLYQALVTQGRVEAIATDTIVTP